MKRTISTLCGLALLAGCSSYQEEIVDVDVTPVRSEVIGATPKRSLFASRQRRLAPVAERRVREPVEITRTQETMARRKANMARQQEAIEMEREIYTSTPAQPSGRISNATPPPLVIDPGTNGVAEQPLRPSGPTSVGERTQVPVAAPVPGKPGYVTSPFSPNAGFIDVNGLPAGSDARDPYTGQVFKVP